MQLISSYKSDNYIYPLSQIYQYHCTAIFEEALECLTPFFHRFEKEIFEIISSHLHHNKDSLKDIINAYCRNINDPVVEKLHLLHLFRTHLKRIYSNFDIQLYDKIETLEKFKRENLDWINECYKYMLCLGFIER